MKNFLLIALLFVTLFSSCKKDDPKPADLILGDWAYYGFENTYYLSDEDTDPETRTGWYSDMIKLNFDGFNVNRIYTHYEPETGPYTIFQLDGKTYIDVPHYHERETFELAKLTKDEMHWIHTKHDVEFVGKHGYRTAKKASIRIMMKRK